MSPREVWSEPLGRCRKRRHSGHQRALFGKFPVCAGNNLKLNSDTSTMSLQAMLDQGNDIRKISTGLQNLQIESSHISSDITRLAAIQEGP